MSGEKKNVSIFIEELIHALYIFVWKIYNNFKFKKLNFELHLNFRGEKINVFQPRNRND